MLSPHLEKLPNPGSYARSWAMCKVAAELGHHVRAFGEVRAGAAVLADLRRALDNRINARGGVSMVGWDRHGDLVHDARVINDSKRRIRWSGRNLLNDARLARRYPDVHNPGRDA